MVLLADESSNKVGEIEPDAKNTGGPTAVSGWDSPKSHVVLTLESEESQEHGERPLNGNQSVPRQGEQ